MPVYSPKDNTVIPKFVYDPKDTKPIAYDPSIVVSDQYSIYKDIKPQVPQQGSCGCGLKNANRKK